MQVLQNESPGIVFSNCYCIIITTVHLAWLMSTYFNIGTVMQVTKANIVAWVNQLKTMVPVST